MAVNLDGVTYFLANEVAEQAGVSRQTLWRWRQDGKVPAGRLFRDRQVLFTEEEIREIKDFATRLEPLGLTRLGQLNLFGGKGPPKPTP